MKRINKNNLCLLAGIFGLMLMQSSGMAAGLVCSLNLAADQSYQAADQQYKVGSYVRTVNIHRIDQYFPLCAEDATADCTSTPTLKQIELNIDYSDVEDGSWVESFSGKLLCDPAMNLLSQEGDISYAGGDQFSFVSYWPMRQGDPLGTRYPRLRMDFTLMGNRILSGTESDYAEYANKVIFQYQENYR